MSEMRLLITCVTVMFATAGNAEIISNGDFEIGDRSNWVWNPAPDVMDAVVQFDVFGDDGNSFAFQVNPNSASIGLGGTLSQFLLLDAETAYDVSWEQGMQNLGSSSITETGLIEVRLGGQLLSSWSQGVLSAGDNAGLSERKVFTPTVTETYELSIRFERRASFGSTTFMYVDNISVVDPSFVPEPTSLLICSIGLVGVTCRHGRLERRAMCNTLVTRSA